MKYKTVRRMDELGRIVLPQEFRNALEWETKTEITMIKEGQQLILQANAGVCFLCESRKPLSNQR